MTFPWNPHVRPFWTTRRLHPENQETPISFLKMNDVTHPLFYRRNHFAYPTIPYHYYWLPVNGAVSAAKLFSWQDLLRYPSTTVAAVLECAGNKRRFFEPKVFGEQWEKGAMSQGEWRGVSLRSLLEETGILEGATEVVLEGYDFGKRTDDKQTYTYARSLPLEAALHPDTILAYEYNGQPIPFQHGYPLRLIVPQWYAMASVKWVKQITVLPERFTGPYQVLDYVYYPHKDNDNDTFPVTIKNVNSTIQQPQDREVLAIGIHTITGIAWTGNGIITKVEVSTDDGDTWVEAEWRNTAGNRYRWVFWSYDWHALEEGEYTILSRATDSANRTQPLTPFWNRKGYGYHAVDYITVKVE